MRPDGLTRRDLLKTGAAAATFAATTNLLTPRRTLAARDHKLVFWLQPNFNPTADKVLEEQTMAFAKEAGLKDSEVQILKVSGGELAPKLTAALEINAPPDVTRLSEAFVARHRALGQLLDISDLMAEMRKVEGGLVPAVIPLTEAGGRYYSVPMGLSPLVFTARTDLFEKAGYSSFPDTWEKLLEASLKLNKPPFYAYGMALGTTPGYSDSTGDILMLMWSNGGKLLDKDSRPAASSPGTVAAFQFIKDMYAKHQIIPKGAVSWDNAGNNKAYQSQQVAYVYDGTSIFSYLLTSDTELAARTGLFAAPAGPAGKARHLYTDYYGVFKASPYPEVAKGFIRYLMEPKRYSEFLVATQGRYVPVYPKMQSDPFWTSKPQFAGLLAIGREGQPMSWEGRITPALGEVVSQSLLGKTAHEVLVNGVEPAAAAAKLQAEIVAIYRRMNEPV